MQVTYTTNLDDYVAFNRHFWRKSWSLWAWYPFGWWAPMVAAVGLGAALMMSHDWWLAGEGAVAVGLLYAAFYPSAVRAGWEEGLRDHARETGTRGVL